MLLGLGSPLNARKRLHVGEEGGMLRAGVGFGSPLSARKRLHVGEEGGMR